MLNGEVVRAFLDAQRKDKERAAHYAVTETMLDKVARASLPPNLDINEEAVMVFDDSTRASGRINLVWPDFRLKASFHRRMENVAENPGVNNGTASIKPLVASNWKVGRAHVDEAIVHYETTQVTIDEPLTARAVSVEGSGSPGAYHRILYRGGNFEGFPHEGYDEQQETLQHNQVVTAIFDRPARIRSLSKGKDPDANIIAVTYEGEALDESCARTLWILLSFFVGPRLEIVCYERFDSDGSRASFFIPNGVEHSGIGHPPLRTNGNDGEAFAKQFPAILAKVHSEMAAGFPWHVGFHHLEESYTNFPESAVKNLAVALDSLIEAHVGDIGKARFINKHDYKDLVDSLMHEVRRAAPEKQYPDDFVLHMEAVLTRENHRGTAEKRRMFWKEFGIDADPYGDVLAYRDPALHTGHVLDYLTKINYIGFQSDVARLRTIVNRSFLRRLGYYGPMYDFAAGTTTAT